MTIPLEIPHAGLSSDAYGQSPMTPITWGRWFLEDFWFIYPVSHIYWITGLELVNDNQIRILTMGCGYENFLKTKIFKWYFLFYWRGSRIKEEACNITEDLLAKSNLTMEDWKWMVNHKGWLWNIGFCLWICVLIEIFAGMKKGNCMKCWEVFKKTFQTEESTDFSLSHFFQTWKWGRTWETWCSGEDNVHKILSSPGPHSTNPKPKSMGLGHSKKSHWYQKHLTPLILALPITFVKPLSWFKLHIGLS